MTIRVHRTEIVCEATFNQLSRMIESFMDLCFNRTFHSSIYTRTQTVLHHLCARCISNQDTVQHIISSVIEGARSGRTVRLMQG
jgi:hypothetical protein